MSFNIADFSAQIARHGLAKSNLFYVTISLPASLQYLETEIGSRDLSFLCKMVQLPSVDVQTTDIRRNTFGSIQRRPVDFGHNDLQTVFMVDSNFKVMKFFHRWMQEIVNYDTESGYFSEDPSTKLPYEFGYPEDYAATVTVTVYSGNQTDKLYTYKMKHAFPINVGSISLDWENAAEVMALPITFAYEGLKVDGTAVGEVTAVMGRGNGLLTYISAINGYGQAISQLNRPTSIQDLINRLTTVSTIYNSL